MRHRETERGKRERERGEREALKVWWRTVNYSVLNSQINPKGYFFLI